MIGFVIMIMILMVMYLIYSTLWVKFSYVQVGHSADVTKKKIRIVQLSDLHGRTRYLNGSISQLVNKLQPDYVMITGDLATKLKQLDSVLVELSAIKCPHQYVVPGNYEREGLVGWRKQHYSEQTYNDIIQRLRAFNMTVLLNEGIDIQTEGKKLFVYGFDNSFYGNERLTLHEADLDTYDFVIMLAHSPSLIRSPQLEKAPYDLLLVGHTHGGQIRVLGRTIGAYSHHHVGLKRLDERRNFYINRGIGTVRIPLRLACPPEIAVFDIAI
jgi:predicted MPP superfamily phosphohydrolase